MEWQPDPFRHCDWQISHLLRHQRYQGVLGRGGRPASKAARSGQLSTVSLKLYDFKLEVGTGVRPASLIGPLQGLHCWRAVEKWTGHDSLFTTATPAAMVRTSVSGLPCPLTWFHRSRHPACGFRGSKLLFRPFWLATATADRTPEMPSRESTHPDPGAQNSPSPLFCSSIGSTWPRLLATPQAAGAIDVSGAGLRRRMAMERRIRQLQQLEPYEAWHGQADQVATACKLYPISVQALRRIQIT